MSVSGNRRGLTKMLADLAPRVFILLLLFCFQDGCKSRHHVEYVEPADAEAVLVVHPSGGDTFDVFLDGKRLGRISWMQSYGVIAGTHVFGAKEVRRLTSAGMSADYTFTVSPGETVHLAVSLWGEYGPGTISGTEELKHAGIRISQIHP